MKLTLLHQYLFFSPFTIDIPDFTVITGLNGSGKTHFLNAIKNLTITNDIVNNSIFINYRQSSYYIHTSSNFFTNEMRYFDFQV